MSDLPSGLTSLELAAHIRRQIDQGHAYARLRKHRFRRRAVALRVAVVLLSAVSTIILGLQNLDPWTGTAFSLVAVVTAIATLEPFFAWRSLWVAMEKASYRFHRVRDDLEFYVANTPPEQLDTDRLRATFAQYQQIWEELSTSWLSFRENGER